MPFNFFVIAKDLTALGLDETDAEYLREVLKLYDLNDKQLSTYCFSSCQDENCGDISSSANLVTFTMPSPASFLSPTIVMLPRDLSTFSFKRVVLT